MATLRQKRLARKIVENATLDESQSAGELLKSEGYGKSLQNHPKRVLESEGVKEELIKLGFHEDNAKRVVGEILDNTELDANPRLKAAEMVFKVAGSFAPEKQITLNVDVQPNERVAGVIAQLTKRG